MKLISKKDIIIPKGTVFNNCDNLNIRLINDNYDYMLALDNDTCVRIVVSSENKEYFEVVDE